MTDKLQRILTDRGEGPSGGNSIPLGMSERRAQHIRFRRSLIENLKSKGLQPGSTVVLAHSDTPYVVRKITLDEVFVKGISGAVNVRGMKIIQPSSTKA